MGRLELDSLKVGAQINESKSKAQFEQERDGIQMGADIAKSKAEMELQARTAALQNSRNQGSRK